MKVPVEIKLIVIFFLVIVCLIMADARGIRLVDPEPGPPVVIDANGDIVPHK